jgi:hypothetical protein
MNVKRPATFLGWSVLDYVVAVVALVVCLVNLLR